MQWSAMFGFGLVLSGQYFSNLPFSFYAKSEFWLNSPGLVFVKLGVVLLLGSFAYVWSERTWGTSWSWLRQLGTASLLVYWVHIELVYGRWFPEWKERLEAWQCALVAAVLIVLMVGLATLKSWLTPARIADLLARMLSQDKVRQPSQSGARHKSEADGL